MKGIPRKGRASVEEQLALLKLAGWQVEYDTGYYTPKWVVYLSDRAMLLNDTTKEQAIRRAFGYFIRGCR